MGGWGIATWVKLKKAEIMLLLDNSNFDDGTLSVMLIKVFYICPISINHGFNKPFKSFYMDTFGKRMAALHKERKMSQDEVGKFVNVHGAVIGRYERDEVKPSIEMATQLAEALEVSLDYMVGSTDVLLERSVVNRVLDIQKLKDTEKQHVFALLDSFIKQTKMQAIM